MNQVILIGNVGKEPESRATGSGSVVNFSLAINTYGKGANGERTTDTLWLPCTAFNKTADIISQYVHKGNKLAITGRLKEEKWVDKTGNERSKIVVIVNEVELVTPKSDNQQPQQQKYTPPPQDSDYIPGGDEPDVIPF